MSEEDSGNERGDKPHEVVIIGGGFGGLHAALSLRRAPVRVTLLDRRNHHLFQPLLYQVATGGLSPANIASPLRAILKRQKNTRVLFAEATDIDVANRRVVLSDGEVSYDTLIVATGAQQHYFGHDEWERVAPGLKTIEDATRIRRRVLVAFEAAERESDPDELKAWLTFVIVGAGPTGVELAGALAEIAHQTFKRDFRSINPADAEIVLLDGTDRVLPMYPPALSAKAEASLARLGVTVRTGGIVTDVQPHSVTVRFGERDESIYSHTVLWTAGVQASPLGRSLTTATGAEADRAGRVVVEADLSLAGYPEIFVIGDLASFSHQAGSPLPGLAAVATQQGRYVGNLVKRRLRGQSLKPFRYKDRGSMATIGRAAAVADLGRIRLSGRVAWLAWLFIHLMLLVGFQNRLLVLMQWAWSFLSRNRSARLITGESPLPFRVREG
ncbi:MAG: NAD(P)/FAD-dependent oxidoreductase [Chloroflexi bacterium]|nr:NAD(P)/FAD-dependent oxidoreductase [Chloroflexota bacterium]